MGDGLGVGVGLGDVVDGVGLGLEVGADDDGLEDGLDDALLEGDAEAVAELLGLEEGLLADFLGEGDVLEDLIGDAEALARADLLGDADELAEAEELARVLLCGFLCRFLRLAGLATAAVSTAFFGTDPHAVLAADAWVATFAASASLTV